MYYNELLDAFHLRLGRLTQASASLDFNVGLALNWLGPYNGEDIVKFLDPKRMQLCKRLEKLEELVRRTFDKKQLGVLKDFDLWFRRADAVRALRNDYVHARWGFPGDLDGEPPYVLFLRLNWNLEPNQPDTSVKVPLTELDQQFAEVEALAGEFNSLWRKHAKHAAPASWWIAQNQTTASKTHLV